MINKQWVVGAQDRFHGRYSFAIITIDEELVLKCGNDRELAQHIVDAHNNLLLDMESKHD